jgi:hypothetical protein
MHSILNNFNLWNTYSLVPVHAVSSGLLYLALELADCTEMVGRRMAVAA